MFRGATIIVDTGIRRTQIEPPTVDSTVVTPDTETPVNGETKEALVVRPSENDRG
jgi:hypothetical protein